MARRPPPPIAQAKPAPAEAADLPTQHDAIDDTPHDTHHPSGIECITITEHMGFNLGNAVQYIWRADLKSDEIEALRMAVWHLDREIARRLKALA